MNDFKKPLCHIDNYPRPQMVRTSFINLNGEWDFAFDYDNVGEKEKWYKKTAFDKKIIVPFSYQTKASGIEEQKHCENVWYLKKLSYSKKSGKKLILNFEGADYITKVYVNGELVGTHRGAYTRFSFDITNFVKAENIIVVKCEDTYDRFQPRGKQRCMDENYGCWYTDTTGLWKTVWAEEVASSYVKTLTYSPSFDEDTLIYEYEIANYSEDLSIEITAWFNGKLISVTEKKIVQRIDKLTVNLLSTKDFWGIQCWYHHTPNFFDIKVVLKKNGKAIDEIGSYAAMARYSARGQEILSNTDPVYLRMVLDQGYFPDSDLTPKSDEEIIQDIRLMKQMGFNGVRKHQKIEDERFYYYCDIMGLFAWCEMPSPYEFRDEEVDRTLVEWLEIVRQYKSHPSIMAWVCFNESWGVMHILDDKKQQALTLSAYYMVKALDQSKFVISNDGWEHTKSDIITIHDYASKGEDLVRKYGNIEERCFNTVSQSKSNRQIFANGYKYEGQPILLSEYAGIAFSGGEKEAWGYGDRVTTVEQYLKRYEDTTDGIYACKSISGFCVTQLTDVMQEINGLLTMDRKPKLPIEELKRIHSK